MAADIENMFSVREMPWHREGTVTQDYPQTFAEARKLAGLDWDPVAYRAGDRILTAAEIRERSREIAMGSAVRSVAETTDAIFSLWECSFRPGDGWNRIARSDTGATLSYQRDSYIIIPNSVFGEIIDAVTGLEPGAVQLETGGCLGGGRRVWMLARLNEPVELPGDKTVTFPYLGITSNHDGQASCAARLTMVRIVCGNTFSLAEAEGQRTGAVYSFPHRGGWRSRIGEAREALNFARTEARQYADVMTNLLGITVSPAQELMWLSEFIPEPPTGITSDRVARNIEEARAAVMGFLDGPAVEGTGVRGTAYGLVQAAGEYLDHVRVARSWETRMNRSLLKTEPLKAKAATLAVAASKM